MPAGMPIHTTHSSGKRESFSQTETSACLPVSQPLPTNGILDNVFLDSLFFIQLKEEQAGCLGKPTQAVP